MSDKVSPNFIGNIAMKANKKLINLSSIVDYFVHPSLAVETDRLHRARILITGLLFNELAIGAITVALAILPFPFMSKLVGIPICLSIGITTYFLLAMLHRSGNYLLASVASILMSFLAILAGILVSGGAAKSPAAQLLAFPPLLAYFFGGARWGGYIVAVTFATIAIFYLLTVNNFQFYDASDGDNAPLSRIFVGMITMLLASGMAYIYEYRSAELKRERDLEQRKVDRLAHTDTLTGLANRRNFDAELCDRIARYRSVGPQRCFALGYLDLDGFKPINDRHGHDVGDEVLQVISDRLRYALRSSDFVGRHGGDEFMLILDALQGESLVGKKAEDLLQLIGSPMQTSVGELSITGSLGFAIFPTHAQDAERLKNAADKAMYAAKRNRSGWSYFESDVV